MFRSACNYMYIYIYIYLRIYIYIFDTYIYIHQYNGIVVTCCKYIIVNRALYMYICVYIYIYIYIDHMVLAIAWIWRKTPGRLAVGVLWLWRWGSWCGHGRMPDIISNMEITLWPIYELVDFGKTFALVYMELPHVLGMWWNNWKVNSCQPYNNSFVLPDVKNPNDIIQL